MAVYHLRYFDKNDALIKAESVFMRSLAAAKTSATVHITPLTHKIVIGDIVDKPFAVRYATGQWDEQQHTPRKTGQNMNKKDLINHIAEHADVNKVQASAALNAIVEGITSTLADGDDVTLVGFGTFKITHRAARKGRNPKTGEEIQIAASKSPTFKAGKELKETVNS